jgi:hypothetical protein
MLIRSIGLDNRQAAVIFWIAVMIAVLVLPSAERRRSAALPLKTLFSTHRLFLTLLGMTLYIAAIVSVFALLGQWREALVAELVFWYFGVAFILFIRTADAAEDPAFFRRRLAQAFTYAVIISFLVNVYTFPVYVEIALVPIVSILAIELVFAQSRDEFKGAMPLITVLLAIAVGSMFWNAIDRIAHDADGFTTASTLRLLLAPVVLTLLLLPFVYLMALWISYSSLYFTLNWQMDEKSLLGYAKWRAFQRCRFRLSRIRHLGLVHSAELLRASSRVHVDRALQTAEKAQVPALDEDEV